MKSYVWLNSSWQIAYKDAYKQKDKILSSQYFKEMYYWSAWLKIIGGGGHNDFILSHSLSKIGTV